MKIVLLGLEFYSGNKGCTALTYSFMEVLSRIAQKKEQKIYITAIVFTVKKSKELPYGITALDCLRITPKKLSFWKRCKKVFAESDFIIDFSMGDSFSDIYGMKRFILTSLLKDLALYSRTPFILGPQTYGPYKNPIVRAWAGRIIRKSSLVYARDGMSCRYVQELYGINMKQTTDIAFSLPYKNCSKKTDGGNLKIGFNPSGLLWSGGYTKNNQFALVLDYQKYCSDLISWLLSQNKYDVFLIPHVGNPEMKGLDNDYIPCYELKRKFGQVTVIEETGSAQDIKSKISEMDIFIGARMHATIASFSSGIATIPLSYSRKFEGLYDSLEYPYVVKAMKLNTQEAVRETIKYIKMYKDLEENVCSSMKIVKSLQIKYEDELMQYLK